MICFHAIFSVWIRNFTAIPIIFHHFTGRDREICLTVNLHKPPIRVEGHECIFACKRGLNMFRQSFGFEYFISVVVEDSDVLGILWESNDFFSEIEKVNANKKEH